MTNETYCGMVKYSVKFRMNPATGVAIDNSYSLEFFKNEDLLYEVNIELYSSNIQYTPTGYKQTYVYLFIIYDSETEELKSLIYDTIHIVYDNRIEYGAYMIKG